MAQSGTGHTPGLYLEGHNEEAADTARTGARQEDRRCPASPSESRCEMTPAVSNRTGRDRLRPHGIPRNSTANPQPR